MMKIGQGKFISSSPFIIILEFLNLSRKKNKNWNETNM